MGVQIRGESSQLGSYPYSRLSSGSLFSEDLRGVAGALSTLCVYLRTMVELKGVHYRRTGY